MSNDNKFIGGLFFKAPHENAPDFIISKGSIKVADMAAWLAQQPGEWVNFDLKESREGKFYASVDDWRPNGGSGGGQQERGPRPQRQEPARQAPPADNFSDDDIPF